MRQNILFRSSGSDLKRHMPSCRSIACSVPTCPSTFRSNSARNAHLKVTHPGVAPHQCSLCKRKFDRENALSAHMVTRHEKGEKKFPCAKCGRSFVLLENLDRHVKLHEEEDIKPVVCDVCDSRFEDDEKLQRHVVTHTKRFNCDHCGQPCSNRLGLER